MKKNLLSIALMATALLAGLTSCSNDDDDSPAPVLYTTYDAWSAVTFVYSPNPMYDDGETVSISKDSIKFHSDTWGDGKFGIQSGEGVLAMENHRTGGVQEYEATISGTKDTGFVITVPSVMGGTTLSVTIGEMPTACAAAGTYKAGIYTNAAYFQKFQPTADQSVSITVNEDMETLTVNFTNSTWGTFTYEAVSVTKNEDGSLSLTGDGKCAMPSMRDPSAVTEYESNFTGTITDGELVAEFSVPGVMGGTTVLFNPADFDEVYQPESEEK
ncbi:MAG: hypothetical protein IJ693_11865 [Bacteroidaceae bacterium]|nr:hypothetical protein [Bacteroidaceae bacterium]